MALSAVTAVGALVLASAPLAGAQTGGPDGPRPHQLTDAERTCLSQHGVSLPEPGQRPSSPPSDAQRQAFAAAAKACGLPAPPDHGGQMRMLTAAEQACLSQHGITPPQPGQKPPTPPSDAQRQAFAAAAKACGLPGPPDHKLPSNDSTGT
jgi:hypothetical protein